MKEPSFTDKATVHFKTNLLMYMF